MKLRTLVPWLALAAAVLSAPVRGTAQPECATPASSVSGDARPQPLAENPIPDMPQLFRDAGIAGTVRVGLVVAADGRVEPGSICAGSEWDLLEDAARPVVARWRFTPARRGGRPVRAAYEAEFRYSARDSIRHTSLRPLTLRHLAGRDSAGMTILPVPFRNAWYGSEALAPVSNASRATRDSAELGMLLTMEFAPPAGSLGCVQDASDWLLARLRQAKPGVLERCAGPATGLMFYAMDWAGPMAGAGDDGVIVAAGKAEWTDPETCNARLCETGSRALYACEAVRGPGGWIAACATVQMRGWSTSY